MTNVARVDLASGTHKYVMIVARDNSSGSSTTLVRSGAGEYHADVLEAATAAMWPAGMECANVSVDCLGGGRIAFDPGAKTVRIYGYSLGFGCADHAASCQLCQEHFGAEYVCEWSNEGY